jgi:hypothetical protein
MECVEIVRHFVKHKEIREQSGGGEISRKNGGERRRERVFRTIKSCPQMVASGLSRSTVINSLSLSHLFCP